MPKVWNRRHGDAPEGAVYVGRPTKWGNPFIVDVHGGRGECVAMHRDWILHSMHAPLDNIGELVGKDLVCWCSPKPCHADTLLLLAAGWDAAEHVAEAASPLTEQGF